jgi:hypothetical protein
LASKNKVPSDKKKCVVPSANAKHVVKKFGDILRGPGVQLLIDMHFLGRWMRNALRGPVAAIRKHGPSPIVEVTTTEQGDPR